MGVGGVGCAVLAVLFMSTSNAVIVYIMRSLTVENRTRRPSGACKTEEDILECVCSRFATQFDTHTHSLCNRKRLLVILRI